MDKVHNVDLAALEKTVDAARADASKARRTQRVEGVWNLDPSQPQFAAEVSFDGQTARLEADQPTWLGGGGRRPGPMQYALFGLASCFTATFATVAAQQGVALERVQTSAEFELNFSKVFGLADLPVVEEVRVRLAVESPAPRADIEAVLREAEIRCPASYCLTNPIRLVATLA
ncbi:MAG: OsmC family protein [Chloroflexi bacterium]|nr:OsmC family protein [Chloroflexota bacterium]